MAANVSPINSDFKDIVIGGGIVGLCLAWFLAEEGSSVLCIDDGRRAGSIANAGSLHVQTQSRLTYQMADDPAGMQRIYSMYPRAVDFWSILAKKLDCDIELRTRGGLMIAEDNPQIQVLDAKCRRERQFGVQSWIIGRQEMLRMAPYLNPTLQGAAYCPQEGMINPLLANAAIRTKALHCGATFQSNTFVDRIECSRRGTLVCSSRGTFRTSRTTIAAGAGSGELAATLGLNIPVTAVPLHMNITEPAEPFMHHLLQHAARPITLKQLESGQLLIGGGWPALSGPTAGAPTVLFDSLIGNLGIAQHVVPGIRDLRLLRSWAGIEAKTDTLSVLGGLASLPGVFFAMPGDAGYTLGPYCARLVVDEMLGRTPDFPLTPFAVSRFGAL